MKLHSIIAVLLVLSWTTRECFGDLSETQAVWKELNLGKDASVQFYCAKYRSRHTPWDRLTTIAVVDRAGESALLAFSHESNVVFSPEKQGHYLMITDRSLRHKHRIWLVRLSRNGMNFIEMGGRLLPGYSDLAYPRGNMDIHIEAKNSKRASIKIGEIISGEQNGKMRGTKLSMCLSWKDLINLANILPNWKHVRTTDSSSAILMDQLDDDPQRNQSKEGIGEQPADGKPPEAPQPPR